MTAAEKILQIDTLRVDSDRDGQSVPIVRDMSMNVAQGELFCLVGESGSGKSVSALALMGLVQRQKGIRVSGSVRYKDEELITGDIGRFASIRGREFAMIFQDPMSSLDPVFRIDEQMKEALRRREKLSAAQERERIAELLTLVGISDVDRCLRQYPHQLSGGMSQRVMIAMALACRPDVLIADEPTTALDVTIQAQILGLLNRLRHETGMTIVLITHDMGIAAQVADHVAVMYAGRVVEQGTPEELFAQPQHPYTVGLLASIPRLDGPKLDLLPAIPGGVPDPKSLPSGCAFHPRCPAATERCQREDPPLAPVNGRPVACWHAEHVAQHGADFSESEHA
ncbi:ABC transporter ATP-binding protein [Paramicrobacterium agarici]|uniref:ABC transporter ATP-binding protein n=1 Tax=Paramicrobacterium agarici TaxID=630514 RepID=UPI001152AF1D|nr:ABC transporter ATP-binding protein [Microbacterium agarici]TQO23309.1 peptide/nickel transport system ATP-binding protein/oligopeptide transport system ATP-binding protein [Microbacterium agarici]